MKHIKVQWCHMDVIFMPKHLICKRLLCAHIFSMIMHFHTGNVYCGAVPNIHVSIFLTKKQIIRIQTQHPQYGFTFITSLDVVLLMVEFRWKTKKYFTCVNNHLHQITIQKYTPEKSYWWWRQKFLIFIPVSTYQPYKIYPYTYHMCAYLVQITVVKYDAQPSHDVNYFNMFNVVVIITRG